MDTPTTTPTRRALANAIRALSMDAVQAANSGHPGAPMGMADISEVLWRDFLKHNPGNPRWWNRDRFVLSNGHGSMLLYSLLHLTGYPLGIDEIKNFRQLGARTAGHPERDLDIGIETTTGPLGQGLANAVGMALAEKMLAGEFNREGLPIVDHHTYCFVGDGCLMEGISHEACSLAGTFNLGKLIVFYDDNGISIDGKVVEWFNDDTPKRFEAYGWHVVKNVDGHDSEAVLAAIKKARARKDQPSLICCKTIIGWGAPNKQGTKSAHGEALGPDEVALARQTLGWEYPPFVVPDDIRAAWDHKEAGAAAEKKWNRIWKRYKREHQQAAAEFERRMKGELPANWPDIVQETLAAGAAVTAAQATRASSQLALNVLGPKLNEMLGGSADLTGSVNTLRKDSKPVTHANPIGNYISYGVREFGMTAMMNGITLHGGFRPYGGTFLVFSDYARNAVRLAALMHARPRWSTRTIPSASVKTGRRTSPSSTWLRCAPCPTCTSGAPAMRSSRRFVGRGTGAQERSDRAGVHAPGVAAADARARAADRDAQGRLRADRQQRSAGSHRHRDRLRSEHRRAGRQGTAGRGQARAPGVHALLRGLRRAARAVPRERVALVGDAAPGHRGRRYAVLVAIRGFTGPRHGSRSFRRLRQGPRSLQTLRADQRRAQGAARTTPS